MSLFASVLAICLHIVCVLIVGIAVSGMMVFRFIISEYKRKEWPEDQSGYARWLFEKRRDALFNTGDGIKAKETFAIQELQDQIFSHFSTAQLYQLRRVCKQWKAATTDNKSSSAMQLAVNKLQVPSLTGEDEWAPWLKDMLTAKDGSARNVIIPGAQVDFLLTQTSLRRRERYHLWYNVWIDAYGPALFIELLLKDKHAHKSMARPREEPVIATYLPDDSRLDMLMFPSPGCGRFHANVVFREPTTSKHSEWTFRLYSKTGIEADKLGWKGRSDYVEGKNTDRKYTNDYTEGDKQCFVLSEWLPSREMHGKLAAHQVPVAGTLREMLAVLEAYCLRESKGCTELTYYDRGDWRETLKMYRVPGWN